MAKEEATAKAFDQLATTGTDNDLEKEFAKLGNHGVDDQLAALKAERAKGAVAPPYVPKELPGPSGSVSTGSTAGEKTSA